MRTESMTKYFHASRIQYDGTPFDLVDINPRVRACVCEEDAGMLFRSPPNFGVMSISRRASRSFDFRVDVGREVFEPVWITIKIAYATLGFRGDAT